MPEPKAKNSKARKRETEAVTTLPKKKKKRPTGNPAIRQVVTYRVEASQPEAHLYTVDCTILAPNPAGEQLALPAWIPGSYLIRDFAKHVVAIRATAGERLAHIEKTAKDEWRVIPPGTCETLTVTIDVYAWDLSVRGAHLDTRHGFFNGTSLFLRVIGREHHACVLDLPRPRGAAYANWRVATAMPRAGATGRGEFGSYQAANYEELIDHPVEMGEFELLEFDAEGVHHEFALSGIHHCDGKRLARDVASICDWQIRFWGTPAPMARYVFLGTAVGDGYGGLEHRASTALLFKRSDLPPPAKPAGDAAPIPVGEAYRGLLGLVSHEYFHTWLVKRIRPLTFAGADGIDLQRENPTTTLWLFEGFTSYYDDLVLRRCGLIDDDAYLACLSKTLAAVRATPGRFRQTLAEASYDAWIKFYKPDENTPNSTVSYYAKGALVALALDLTIREATSAKKSLDDLMRRLWIDHGETGTGVGEEDVRRVLADVVPELDTRSVDRFFARALHATEDLPVAKLLATHGILLEEQGGGQPSLGVRFDTKTPNELRIAVALDGGAAQAAGLAAHDVLLAIDGLRVGADQVDGLLERYRVGDTITVHVFRRDELRQFEVTLRAGEPKTFVLRAAPKVARSVLNLRKRWLAG